MTTNALLDALGVALTPPNTQSGCPISYNSTTGQISIAWGPQYNLSTDQITAIVNAFNNLSTSLLTATAPPPAAPSPPTVTGTRLNLASDQTYYLSPTGSDANDGLTTSTPWLTPTHAYEWCRDNLDLRGHKITIQLLGNISGSWTLKGRLAGQAHADDFVFFGADATWGNQTIHTFSDTTAGAQIFRAEDDARFSVRGVQIAAPSGFGIVVAEGTVVANNVWFNGVGNACFDAAGPRSQIIGKGALVWQQAAYGAAAVAEDHALIILGCDLICSGSPSFSTAFVQGDLGGQIDASPTYPASRVINPGSATGLKHHATQNGIVFTGGTGNVNFFPGSQAGAADTGGYFL